MNTNRNFRAILVIVLIAIASALLSACSETPVQSTMKFVADAAYSEDLPASVQSLQISSRIDECNMSSHQLLINAMNGDVNPETGVVDGMTIGQWLDNKMSAQSCITE